MQFSTHTNPRRPVYSSVHLVRVGSHPNAYQLRNLDLLVSFVTVWLSGPHPTAWMPARARDAYEPFDRPVRSG